jgi:hypothetical protein
MGAVVTDPPRSSGSVPEAPVESPRRWSVLVVAVLGAMAVLPVLVALVASVGRTWVPTGDWAMLELATRDVGTPLTPLLGPYSRMGWNHPGPLLFWLLAGPYRLTGGAPWSMLVTAAALNAVAAAAMVAFAWRNGRLVLAALVSLVAIAITVASSATMAADPWNPWITVLPFGLMVLLAWSTWEGDRAAVWWGVVVGTFLAQSHSGYLPLVGVLVAIAVVGAWRGGMSRRMLRNAGLVGVVLWLPPLIDQVTGRGNLLAVLTGAGGSPTPVGGAGALELVARQLAWDGPWMGGVEPSDAVTGAVVGLEAASLAVPVALFAWGLSLALWRQCRGPARLQLTVLATFAVGIVAVARIDGPAFDYIVRWWWPLAGLWWASTAWSLWEALVRPPVEELASRYLGPRRAAAVAGAVAVVVLVAALPGTIRAVADAATLPSPEEQRSVLASEINDATRAELERLTGVPAGMNGAEAPMVVVHAVGGHAGWYSDALGARLAADGREVGVLNDGVNDGKWGRARMVPKAAPGDADRVDVWVVMGPRAEDPPREVALALSERGSVDAFAWDPLDADQRARRSAAEARLFGQLEAAGRSDLVLRYLDGDSVLAARSVAGVDVEALDQLGRSREAAEQVRVIIVP